MSDDDPDLEIRRHNARIRGRIALYSVIIYLVVGAILIFSAITGLSRIEDAIEILLAWGTFASLVVGAVIGFYFGANR